MYEFVSEQRHFNNLFYVRELMKLELDDWVQDRSNGLCLDDVEDVMGLIENLTIVEKAIGGLHVQITTLEEIKNGNCENGIPTRR